MNSPTLYHSESLQDIDNNMVLTKDGYWTPVRPLGLYGLNLRWRIRLAWRVFIGRYDALQWRDQ